MTKQGHQAILCKKGVKIIERSRTLNNTSFGSQLRTYVQNRPSVHEHDSPTKEFSRIISVF